VPVDGSKPSDAAVERACQLAKTLNSQITLIHVVTESTYAYAQGFGAYGSFESTSGAFDKAGSQILEDAQKIVEKKGCEEG